MTATRWRGVVVEQAKHSQPITSPESILVLLRQSELLKQFADSVVAYNLELTSDVIE
jgi:hypothetical protein